MSQLNLKQILSGDTISQVVDKLNYNFDQIVLNGGGPQGLRGLLGAPGLPGLQGPLGNTGPTGASGPYLYGASGASPGVYPFGTGGEQLPRPGDLYLAAYTSNLEIWQLGLTGGTGAWNQIGNILSPSSQLTTVFHNQPVSSVTTDLANDISIAEKLFIGDSAAFATGPDGTDRPFIFSDTLQIQQSPAFNQSFSLNTGLFSNSLSVFAADSNQLRILSTGLTGTTGANGATVSQVSTGLTDKGGIVHSLQKGFVTSIPVQVYRVVHGDLYGNKFFTLNLNSGTTGPVSTLLHGDMNNKLGVGVPEFHPMSAQLNVRNSLVVGTPGTYINSSSFSGGSGIISEGNLAIGLTSNARAKIHTWGLTGSTLLVDSATNATPNTYSVIALGNNVNQNTSSSSNQTNLWQFIMENIPAGTSASNYGFRSLVLQGFATGLTASGLSGGNSVAFNTMWMQLTASGNLVRPTIGIGNINPNALLEIGAGTHRVSIGDGSGQGNTTTAPYFFTNYIGQNLHRHPVSGNWIRRGTSLGNGGNAIWSNSAGNLYFSFYGSTGTSNVSVGTDTNVTESTRLVIRNNGAIRNSDDPGISNLASEAYPSDLGLYIRFGASGTTGSGTERNRFRRYNGLFGVSSNSSGGVGIAPMIAATQGLTQSSSTSGGNFSILPQYTFYQGANLDDANASGSGLYLAQPTTVNSTVFGGTSLESVGLAIGGTVGLSLHGIWSRQVRMGIFQRDPLERLHIGEKFVISDGNFVSPDATKFIGHNIYQDALGYKRISGAVGATLQGGLMLRFIENNATQATLNSLTSFGRYGTIFTIDTTNTLGASGSTVTNPGIGGGRYQGVMVAPSPRGGAIKNFVSGLTATVFDDSYGTPQVGIGVDLTSNDTYDNQGISARRGSLAIAPQRRGYTFNNIPYFEDNYNIGLYSIYSIPVVGFAADSGLVGATTSKTFGVNFLSDSGNNAVRGTSTDIPIFRAIANTIYPSLTGDQFPNTGRSINFGSGVRVGIGQLGVQVQDTTDPNAPSFDQAFLKVDASSPTGWNSIVSASTSQAILAKGSIVIDTSNTSTLGGNNGLWFKNTGIVAAQPWATAQSQPNNLGANAGAKQSGTNYPGDWSIRYQTITTTSPQRSGLNFEKYSDNISGGASGTVLWLDDTGQVSIGRVPITSGVIQNNTARLTIAGSPFTPNYFVPSGTTSSSFQAGTSLSITSSSITRTSLSLYTVGDVWTAGAFIAASDKRIKNVISLSDSSSDLEILNKIEVTDFTYKDFIANPGHHKKLIAQNLQEVFPQSVSKQTEFIPNIFELSVSIVQVEDLVKIEVTDLQDLQIGDTIRLIDEKNYPSEHLITDVDPSTSSFYVKTNLKFKDQIFVFGKLVDDFLTVDYDAVFSLNVSATQQLHKVVKSQAETINSQAETIKNLEEKLSKIESLLSKHGII